MDALFFGGLMAAFIWVNYLAPAVKSNRELSAERQAKAHAENAKAQAEMARAEEARMRMKEIEVRMARDAAKVQRDNDMEVQLAALAAKVFQPEMPQTRREAIELMDDAEMPPFEADEGYWESFDSYESEDTYH